MAKITVGLLVFNEDSYLQKSLENICAVAPKDCEILIGNNASIDNSSEIIDAFALRDSRIIHIKRDINVGALENWRDLVMRATGEYFVLAGGHDLWVGDYLGELSRALDNNPEAVISYSKTEWIDDEGRVIDRKEPIVDTSGMKPFACFVSVFFMNQHPLYGMIRLSALRKTRLQLDIIGSGEILLQELVQQGDFIIVEGIAWRRRMVRRSEASLERLKRYSCVLFPEGRSRRKFLFFPYGQMMFIYCSLPFVLAGLKWSDRFRILMFVPVIMSRFLPAIIKIDLPWLFNGGGACGFFRR